MSADIAGVGSTAERGQKKRCGSLTIPTGLAIRPHELATAERLRQQGFNVEFLPLSHQDKVKNPDILLDGQVWEMKSPQGESPANTIDVQLRAASHQATRLVLDTARTPLTDEFIETDVLRRLAFRTRIERVLIVRKDGTTKLIQQP